MEKVVVEVFTEGDATPLLDLLASYLDSLEDDPELGICTDPGTAIKAVPIED